MTVLQMVQRWATDLAEAGHDGDAVIVLPPRLFADALDEYHQLVGSRLAGYLPPVTSVVELGNPPQSSELRFAAPSGWIRLRAEAAS